MEAKANGSQVNISFPLPRPFSPWIMMIPEDEKAAYVISYSLILVFSILGNSYIIAIVLRNRHMHSTSNFLIANMAFSDLAGSIAATAPSLRFFHQKSFEWMVTGTFGNILCKLSQFTRDVSITVSIVSMVAIGFDRFFAVYFPMKQTPRVFDTRFMLPLIWVIAVASFSIHFVTFKLVPLVPNVYLCEVVWPDNFDPKAFVTIFLLIVLILYFILPFIIITIIYIAIACKIKKQTVPGQQTEDVERRRRRRNHGIIKLAFTIVICFFACWIPHHIVMLFEIFVWKDELPASILPYYSVLLESTTIISYLSFFTNPLVCVIFSSNYRKSLKRTFPFSLCCLSNRIGILDSASIPRDETTLRRTRNNTMMMAVTE